MGNLRRCDHSVTISKTVKQHWVHKIFWTKDKGPGGVVLNFRRETGQFTGS